ncbi:MAG: glutaredoxin [Actinobacteria bacterium]|nr:MAG: glutaredoxin [Actinomycetota bacterium]
MAVVLYTSERCGLCDRAKEALSRLGVAFEEIEVGDGHPYRLRTPVIERDGSVVAEGAVDHVSLARALGRERPGSSPREG